MNVNELVLAHYNGKLTIHEALVEAYTKGYEEALRDEAPQG